MNYRPIVVFDFESDSPNASSCNIVQIGAIVLDSRTLKEKWGGRFNMKVKPPGIDKIDDYLTEERKNTIAWHAKNRDMTSEEIIEEWSTSCDEKHAWECFVDFVMSFNRKKTSFTAPIPCGMNIKDFDIPIAKRLCEKYKTKTLFWWRDAYDIQQCCFEWFESREDAPYNHKLETVCEYVGVENKQAHDALSDVIVEAYIARRFLKLNRRLAPKIKFGE